MPYFRQTFEDNIVINDTDDVADEVSFPLSFFLTQEPGYSEPPAGYAREYVPDGHKTIFNSAGDTTVEQIVQYRVSYLERSGSTVTVTLFDVAHGISITDDIEIENSPDSDYNGIWTVTALPDVNKIQFDIGVLTPATPIKGPDILLFHSWVDGDDYISTKDTYWDNYLLLPASLETAKASRKQEATNYWANKNKADVLSYNLYATDYDFPGNRYDRYHKEWDYAEANSALHSSYHALDVDDVKITAFVTVADLRGLVDLNQEYLWEGDSNLDDHYIAIDALATVALVEAYDFTTGYPTTPYT